MKTGFFKVILVTGLALVGNPCGLAQGFVNLDFEAATIPSNPTYSDITASNLFPGWTVSARLVSYNSFAISGGSISIIDTNSQYVLTPIQGKYYALLTSANILGFGFPVSLSQTGQIPLIAHSMTFWGDLQNMQITFNGQPLSFSVIGSTPHYSIFGADVSAYAGQTGELLFTVPPYMPGSAGGVLDNIQFSPTIVPEPGSLALAALGTLILSLRRRRKPPQS